MEKNIVLITPCDSYGDTLSIIGLLYYLHNYYERVYLLIEIKLAIYEHYLGYFENDPLKDRIYVINSILEIPNDCHVCDLSTNDWKNPSFKYYDYEKVNKNWYFNPGRPLSLKFKIPEEDIIDCLTIPLGSVEINHLVYYKFIGLNNNVRMNYFNYSRNITKELEIKEQILKQFNITDKYIIINNPDDSNYNIQLNNFINISELSKVYNLLSLIEGAESIHLIEGNNVNFLYHCQYKEIFKYDGPIYFHIWARNRNWKDLKLDYAWRMMETPKLDNWQFIFEESEGRKCN